MGDYDPSIVYETKCWHAASRIFVSIHILSPRSLTSLYLRAIDMNCPRPYIHTTIVPDNNKESDSIIHRSGHKWWQPPISSSISIYFLLDLWRVYTCKPIIEFPYEFSLSICSHTDCVDHYNISLERLHPPKLYVLINFYVV